MTHWYPRFESFSISDHSVKRYFTDLFGSSRMYRRLGLPPDMLEEVVRGATTYREVFVELMEEYRRTQDGCTRWGEKTPGNYRAIDRIRSWFPDASPLFIIRDPRAGWASLKRTHWGVKSVGYYAQEWAWFVDRVVENDVENGSMILRYEDLVSQPDELSEQVLRHIGAVAALSRDELSPASEGFDTDWHRQHQAKAYGPIETSSVEKWRAELEAQEVELIESICGERMDRMGYGRETRGAGSGRVWAATSKGTGIRVRHKAARAKNRLLDALRIRLGNGDDARSDINRVG